MTDPFSVPKKVEAEVRPIRPAELAVRYFTLAEAARYIGVSTPTLRKFAYVKRQITFVQIGKRMRFRKEDLDTYLSRVTAHAIEE